MQFGKLESEKPSNSPSHPRPSHLLTQPTISPKIKTWPSPKVGNYPTKTNHFDTDACSTPTDFNPALESSLNKLSIRPEPPSSTAARKNKQKVTESWEDDELEDSGDDADRPLSHQQSADFPLAPPPTPISPSTSFAREGFISPYGYSADGGSAGRPERSSARPDKTDAMAKRMIAGALGVRAPKRTEEQKAYDKAIKEKEIKRRNLEKEAAARAKEDAEKQKAAIWDD